MNFRRFSKREFEECGIDTDAARLLADSLQEEVTKELQAAVLAAFDRVIRSLNEQGHNLKPFEVSPGDINYRDESEDGKIGLRLACDVVISAGYAHLYSGGKTADEIIDEEIERLKKNDDISDVS